jgi:hypothetical protein
MVIDAQVAERLLSNTLVASADKLVDCYKNAFSKVPGSEREHDSVLKQLNLIGSFYGVLAGGIKDSKQRSAMQSISKSLHSIAQGLRPSAAADESSNVKESPRETVSKADQTTKGRRKKPTRRTSKTKSKPKASSAE